MGPIHLSLFSKENEGLVKTIFACVLINIILQMLLNWAQKYWTQIIQTQLAICIRMHSLFLTVMNKRFMTDLPWTRSLFRDEICFCRNENVSEISMSY